MNDAKHPSELARETLRQLAMRRVPPTPDNYRTLYNEIAGIPADEPLRWPEMIRGLVAQLQARHAGVTPARKRQMLDHVLASSGTPERLFERLQSLTKSWSQGAAAESALMADANDANAFATTPTTVTAGERAEGPPIGGDLRELLAELLDRTLHVLLIDTPELNQEAAGLAADIRAAATEAQISAFTGKLKKFTYRLHFVAEDQAELRTALLRLLQLIIENIGELVIDDRWVSGQVSVVSDLVGQPLNLRQLDDVERRMKDLIYKQSTLKKSLNDAQERLRVMLATFVDRLSDFAATTGEYHERIGACAQKIKDSSNITDLADVLDVLSQETRAVQLAVQRSRDELLEMRTRVEEAEQQIAQLQQELAQASEIVRHDALTGVLNRKGLGEAFEREVGRARRKNAPMCLAMLDVDNFKALNDTHGHDAGDEALVHLAKVVRETLRPQDTLARYGGEEFVIILTDTQLEDAVRAMTRVQRELTRRFFLHQNEKILITFSCGVAELGAEESPDAAVRRADQAMYLAKRAGKNRVVAA
jgi:diguanylate cyclase